MANAQGWPCGTTEPRRGRGKRGCCGMQPTHQPRSSPCTAPRTILCPALAEEGRVRGGGGTDADPQLSPVLGQRFSGRRGWCPGAAPSPLQSRASFEQGREGSTPCLGQSWLGGSGPLPALGQREPLTALSGPNHPSSMQALRCQQPPGSHRSSMPRSPQPGTPTLRVPHPCGRPPPARQPTPGCPVATGLQLGTHPPSAPWHLFGDEQTKGETANTPQLMAPQHPCLALTTAAPLTPLAPLQPGLYNDSRARGIRKLRAHLSCKETSHVLKSCTQDKLIYSN